MRTALFVVALVSTAHADAYRPQLELLYEFNGIDVMESINDFNHKKGDSGATVDSLHVYLSNKDAKEHFVRFKKVELLHGHCNSQKWADRTPIAVKDLEVYGWEDMKPRATSKDKVAIPAVRDLWSVHTNFKSFQVYNECDRFAFGITIEIDGTTKPIELLMKVTREDPK